MSEKVVYKPSEVAQAFNLNPVTIRSWHNDANNPLETDADSDGGAKRRLYSLADLVRFALLKQLINELKIEASASISLVNALFDEISAWTSAAIEYAQAEKTWRLVPSRWLFLRGLTNEYVAAGCGAHLIPEKSFGGLVDQLNNGATAAILIDLTAVVVDAVHSAGNIRVWEDAEPSDTE
jgi:hypothetical protein